MYVPKIYTETDREEMAALIRQHSFGLLVSAVGQTPLATHLPMQLEVHENGDWGIAGHMARANSQWKSFTENTEVLAVFTGPHSYISPSWYNHANVPTWNYRAVHLYGKIRLIEGAELEELLQMQMRHYESLHAAKPLHYEDIPEKTLAADLRGVVAFRISINKIEATRKLSQNRDTESYNLVIEHLEKSADPQAHEIAKAMRAERPEKKS